MAASGLNRMPSPCPPTLLLEDHVKGDQPPGPTTIDLRSPPPPTRSNKYSREQLFRALEQEPMVVRTPRDIQSADDLDEIELKKCFEILHGCGKATDPGATLKSTRETIETFLDAVFRDWTGNSLDEPIKPIMDFVARDFDCVAHICDYPSEHQSESECYLSGTCRSKVFRHASYTSKRAKVELGYLIIESSEARQQLDKGEPQYSCLMGRNDVRWLRNNQIGLLGYRLAQACIAKIHKHNKHLAVYQVRRLVQRWATGSISMDQEDDAVEYHTTEALDMIFSIVWPMGENGSRDL